LQAHSAELRFARLFSDAGKLDIEGAQRKEIGASRARCEGGGKGAVRIARSRNVSYRDAPLGLMQARLNRVRRAPPPVPSPWPRPGQRSRPHAARQG
jgi:hypothetical protein